MGQLYQQDMFDAMPFPQFPLCSDDLSHGVWREKLSKARLLPYIQANPQRLVWALLFDVDRPHAALSWDYTDMPPPTWTTENPENGHAHLAYKLVAPVAVSNAARMKPIRFLAGIQAEMTRTLGADRAYVGLITKTPMHPAWRTKVWRQEPYELTELAEWLPEDFMWRPKPPRPETIALGRNVTLFDELRAWAYPKRRSYSAWGPWHQECLAQAQLLNTFPTPLPYSEVKATAKSVAKWTYAKCSPANFSRLQAIRGSKGGKVSAPLTNAKRQMELIDIQGELLK